MVQVATRYLGDPPGRRGDRSRRVWWVCPIHQDRNPSFAVDPDKQTWKCFGCGEYGDAASLVMKLQGVGFREAVAILADPMSSPLVVPTSRKPSPRKADSKPDPDAMTRDEAAAVVEASEARLWSEDGAEALAYLRGRGFTDETIRAARLGWTPRLARVAWSPQGVTWPWFREGELLILKIRCDLSFIGRFPQQRQPPRYIEAYRSPYASDRDDPACYPCLETIEPGMPVAVVEGEADALLLGQVLRGLVSVVTLGAASNPPGPSTLSGIAPAWPRFACHDDDAAGDKAAARWPASFRRIRPPGSFHRDAGGALVNDKDWSDAYAQGIDLRRWWDAILDGDENPPLYTWDELERRNPPEPAEPWTGPDPYEAAEREAIQWVERQEVPS